MSLVLIEDIDPAIRVLTLNRPDKRNALSIALMDELRLAILSTQADLARRVIVLMGAGPVFCAGLDLVEASDSSLAHQSAQLLASLYETICTSPLIVIAAVHAAAIGGGAGLVAASDLVVGSHDLKIGFPEVHRGLIAALITCLIRRQLSDRQTRQIILLGQHVPAQRARELGLIDYVCPADQLLQRAVELAHEICTGAPDAVTRSKRLLDDVSPRPIVEELSRALAYHLSSRTSLEAVEGIAAFRAKRAPRWGSRTE